MILLSNSLPKTGSTLLASYQEDILQAANVKSGQDVLHARHGGRFIRRPTNEALLDLYKIDSQSGSVVVKCHWAPHLKLKLYCRLPNVRMTMAYRDPRDMILSMIDHGKRTREGLDPSGAFADCSNVIDLVSYVSKFLNQLDFWMKKNYVHSVRYEDLMADPFRVLKDMNAFLGWEVSDACLRNIIEKREGSKATSHNFNKGTTERWRTEMNQAEKDACLEGFRPHLSKLNYSLT